MVITLIGCGGSGSSASDNSGEEAEAAPEETSFAIEGSWHIYAVTANGEVTEAKTAAQKEVSTIKISGDQVNFLINGKEETGTCRLVGDSDKMAEIGLDENAELYYLDIGVNSYPVLYNDNGYIMVFIDGKISTDNYVIYEKD